MNEQAANRYDTQVIKRRNWDQVWKYVAIAAMSLCAGIMEGQVVPNRNIVTQDQIKDFASKLDILNNQVGTLNAQLAELRGEEQAREATGKP